MVISFNMVNRTGQRLVAAVVLCLPLVGCGVKEETLHENLAPVTRQTEELQVEQQALEARLAASEAEMTRLRAELDAMRPQNRKGGKAGKAGKVAAPASPVAPAATMPDGRPIPAPRVLTAAEAAVLDMKVAGTGGAVTASGAGAVASPISPAAMPPHGPIRSGTLTVTAPGAAVVITPTSTVSAPSAAVAKEPKPNAEQGAYRKALSTYERKSFAEAETQFDQFMQQWPNSKLAPNALYWKAECLYSRGKFADSVFVFKDVVTRYPKHPKAADALLKSAMAYKRLGDMDNANLHISVLTEDYPTSTALKRAREFGFGR